MDNKTIISKISINNFRNHDSKVLSFQPEKQFVVISGQNGAGKTNILEAISLFSPGKGLRKSSNDNFKNINNPNLVWGINIELNIDENKHNLGTGILSPDSTRRVIRINQESIKSRTMLSEYLSIIWLTPQIDKIFIESKSIRRRFFDKMMIDLKPSLSHLFFEYDKAMKDRTKILKENFNDSVWLLKLEQVMIEKGIEIAKERISFCEKLNAQIQKDNISNFPKGDIQISGHFEDLLKEHSDEVVSQISFDEFLANRHRDSIRGGATIGAHKSDFIVKYIDKNMPASLCSTGEQKSLLISTFLSFAHEMKDTHKKAPIILLDELVAHLDFDRKNSLFEELKKLSSQVFMTGTEDNLFNEIKDCSQTIQL